MRITNDDLKPSLDEALEHYGVQGMKWGVRRDQKALDRSAGRSLSKGRPRDDQIKDARGSVIRKKANLNKASVKVAKLEKAAYNARGKADVAKEKKLAPMNYKPGSNEWAKNIDPAREKEYEQNAKKAEAQVRLAQKQFQEAQKDFDNNPARALSARMTYGEMVVSSLFLTPVATVTLVGVTEGVAAKRRAELRK